MRLWDYLKLCLLILVVLVPGTLIMVSGHLTQARRERLIQTGIKVTAKIEDLTITDHKQNGAHLSYTYELKLRYPYSSQLVPLSIDEETFKRISPDGKRFQQGTEIEVVVDPHDPSNVAMAGTLGQGGNHNDLLLAIGVTVGFALLITLRVLISEARRRSAEKARMRSNPPPLPR